MLSVENVAKALVQPAASAGTAAENTHQGFMQALADLNATIEAEKTKLLFEVKEKQDEVAAKRAEEEKEKRLEELRREIANLKAKLAAAPAGEEAAGAEGQLAMLESQLMLLFTHGA